MGLKSRGGVEIKEIALKTAREHQIYVTLFTTFTKDAHGELEGYQGMLYDITDKKELVLLRKAEEALRELFGRFLTKILQFRVELSFEFTLFSLSSSSLFDSGRFHLLACPAVNTSL